METWVMSLTRCLGIQALKTGCVVRYINVNAGESNPYNVLPMFMHHREFYEIYGQPVQVLTNRKVWFIWLL